MFGAAVIRRLGDRIGVGRAFALGTLLHAAPLMLVPLAGGPRPLVLAMLFLAPLRLRGTLWIAAIGAALAFL